MKKKKTQKQMGELLTNAFCVGYCAPLAASLPLARTQPHAGTGSRGWCRILGLAWDSGVGIRSQGRHGILRSPSDPGVGSGSQGRHQSLGLALEPGVCMGSQSQHWTLGLESDPGAGTRSQAQHRIPRSAPGPKVCIVSQGLHGIPGSAPDPGVGIGSRGWDQIPGLASDRGSAPAPGVGPAASPPGWIWGRPGGAWRGVSSPTAVWGLRPTCRSRDRPSAPPSARRVPAPPQPPPRPTSLSPLPPPPSGAPGLIRRPRLRPAREMFPNASHFSHAPAAAAHRGQADERGRNPPRCPVSGSEPLVAEDIPGFISQLGPNHSSPPKPFWTALSWRGAANANRHLEKQPGERNHHPKICLNPLEKGVPVPADTGGLCPPAGPGSPSRTLISPP